MSKKLEQQEAQRDRYAAAVAGMTDRKITSEMEKRQKIIGDLATNGLAQTEEYQEAFSQLKVLTDELRARLTKLSPAQRMQVRRAVRA